MGNKQDKAMSRRFVVFSNTGDLSDGQLVRVNVDSKWQSQIRSTVAKSSSDQVFCILPDTSAHPLSHLRALPDDRLVKLVVVPAGESLNYQCSSAVSVEIKDPPKQLSVEQKGGNVRSPKRSLFEPSFEVLRNAVREERRRTLVQTRKVESSCPSHLVQVGMPLKMAVKALAKFTLKQVPQEVTEKFSRLYCGVGALFTEPTDLVKIAVTEHCVRVTVSTDDSGPCTAVLWFDRKGSCKVDFAKLVFPGKVYYLAPSMVEIGSHKQQTYFRRLVISVYEARKSNKHDDGTIAVEPKIDKPIIGLPIIDEPIYDEPILDEPILDEPIIDDPPFFDPGFNLNPVPDFLDPDMPGGRYGDLQLEKPVVYLRPSSHRQRFELTVSTKQQLSMQYQLPVPQRMCSKGNTSQWAGTALRCGSLLLRRPVRKPSALSGGKELLPLQRKTAVRMRQSTTELLLRMAQRSRGFYKRFGLRTLPKVSLFRMVRDQQTAPRKAFPSIFWEANRPRSKTPLGGRFSSQNSLRVRVSGGDKSTAVWFDAMLTWLSRSVAGMSAEESSEFAEYWTTRICEQVTQHDGRWHVLVRFIDPERLASMSLTSHGKIVQASDIATFLRVYMECQIVQPDDEDEKEWDGRIVDTSQNPTTAVRDMVRLTRNVQCGHHFLDTTKPKRNRDSRSKIARDPKWSRVVEWGGIMYT